jgi:dynein heavy chain
MKAVASLSAADVTEMKGFKTPPVPAIAVAKTLCMFFFKKPIMIAGPTPGSKIPDYWTTAKKEVLSATLLKQLQEYPKDNMDPKLVEDMRPILESEDYSDEKLKNASKAAHGIAKWCRAMI